MANTASGMRGLTIVVWEPLGIATTSPAAGPLYEHDLWIVCAPGATGTWNMKFAPLLNASHRGTATIIQGEP
jgi:hypothetical protein